MSTSTRTYQNGTSPTVLLVHGAFEDTSMWAGVIPTLLVAGIDVRSVANPLRGLTVDAAYLAGIAADIDGPVLFAGHAYGGAVLTVAGSSSGNVVGLVYVAAFAIDAGESALDIATRFPESRLNRALRPAAFQTCAGEPAVELDISRDEFAEVFAADLADPVTRVLAACQRPIAATALEEKAQVAAWRTLPSWYLVASADRVIHPDAQRFMAQRAGAETVEIDASHAVALSHPAAVAELIRSAATVRPRRFP